MEIDLRGCGTQVLVEVWIVGLTELLVLHEDLGSVALLIWLVRPGGHAFPKSVHLSLDGGNHVLHHLDLFEHLLDRRLLEASSLRLIHRI